MKQCTQKTSGCVLNVAFALFQSCSSYQSWWVAARKWHQKSTVFIPLSLKNKTRVPLQARSRVCPHPLVLGTSSDKLRLPGLAGYLGTTLWDDQRSRQALAVQAETADHVLQSHAFWFPLLQKQKRWKGWMSFSADVLGHPELCSSPCAKVSDE